MTLPLSFDEHTPHRIEVRPYARRVLCSFFAVGRPRPKGNMRPFVRAGRAMMHEATAGIDEWMRALRGSAYAAMGADAPSTRAIALELHWKHIRPAGHFTATGKLSKRGRSQPRPVTRSTSDIDKLERAILDALGGTKKHNPIAFCDDSQVCEVYKTQEWGLTAGVEVVVSEIIDA